MKNIRPSTFQLLAIGALMSMASLGQAATTWTPGTAAACNLAVGTTYQACSGSAVTSNGVTATSSAYSTTGTNQTLAGATLYDHDFNSMGVVSAAEMPGAEPQHAMDNVSSTDLISIKFSSALVALTAVTTTYVSGDSDMSLLAYTGTNGQYSLVGKTTANLITDGWKLVATINGGTAGATYAGLNAGGITSSWWIISAYNSGYGGTGAGVDAGDDYMKLLSVAGDIKTTTSKVPEPGSLMLMGAAFCAAVGARRRAMGKANKANTTLAA
jgi:hypothetical protein